MHFTRLRLSGFKSFVDPTELRIEPGLTGVVGPNGCGKSNLLEALRWVMGENSAKSMRGGDMDDVIFAGTTKRPARNLAEVSLSVDNSDRRAPAAFNDEVDLEISRRIERDSGSAYRVNGKEVRARDVHLLFADAATGAHSPALVSQGRVSALIAAKPRDRRAILEEAAGISGLHSRRDEAERRLRAAEVNLVRLHDVMQQIESQLTNLRRQAGQAKRYKKISAEIRHLAGVELYAQWKRANALLFAGEATLREAEAKVADLTANSSRLATEQAILASRMPDLRHAEAEAAASLHHLILARDGLAAEEQRLAETRAKLMAYLQDVGQDIAREQTIIHEVDATLAKIAADSEEITLAIENEGDAQKAAALRLEEAAQLARATEAALDKAKSDAAAAMAQRDRYAQEFEIASRRLARLDEEAENIKGQRETLSQTSDLLAQLAESEAAIALAEATVEATAAAQEEAEQSHIAARTHEQTTQTSREQHRHNLARLATERDTLAKILKTSGDQPFTPLIDRLQVTPGYEAALGAALGDDLQAPVDEAAPARWTTQPGYTTPQALPKGATALSHFVNAPAALARRLSQTGVPNDDANPTELAKALLPGQRLVTREGALFRWDGFWVTADAPSPAAIRLAQRNRLSELEAGVSNAETQLKHWEEAYAAAHAGTAAAAGAEQDHRRRWREAEEALTHAHKTLAQTSARATSMKAQMAALEARIEALAHNRQEALAQQEIAAATLENLAAFETAPENVATAQAAAEEQRQALSDAHAAHDNLRLQSRHRRQQLETLAQQSAALTQRRSSAGMQIETLTERAENSRAELAALEDRPHLIAQSRRRLGDQIAEAEAKRQKDADALAAAEQELAAKDSELRSGQSSLSNAREERVRLATGIEQLSERRRDVTQRIAEDFDCVPQHLLAALEVADPENLPTPDELSTRLEKLKAERERMGPVNLRAEVEVAEYEAQIANLEHECADLENAIARLRQAIGSLNREGRERLLSAFEQVNSHFGTLFQTLFGGGHAHLELTESADPLEAGLEIMASPPGKRLQVLSLLSGGEQALTALSLIFAVFMTNPAPICVLDEVDAPLDDANVERFCNLLDDMVSRTHTRFLIVTHNVVTMSRMNRLFGVTMVERGISQLVSVDLERVEGLRAAS